MRCITWLLAVLNYSGMTSGRKRLLTTVGGLKKQKGIYFKELDVRSKHLSFLSLATIVFTLAACGGGGGGGNRGAVTVAPPAPVQSDFEQGVFQAQSMFAAMCETPRVGSSDAQGSTENENEWLRAWSHDLYLWYNEIIYEDPAAHTTPAYFDLMRTFATTPSGADKDQFHFTYDTEEWELLSQQGISAGYGADVVLIASSPPRRAVVALVQPGSPAAAAGVTRGSAIVEVDGADLVNGDDVDTLNAGLFPSGAGESHDFMIEDFDGSNRRAITLVSTEVTEETVPVSQVFNTAAGPVGYMVFTSFLAPAEERLVTEFEFLAGEGVTEFILDLRYNGGGFLDIANELSFMIAGPAAASGQIFAETQFNDKHPNTNPVTGAALTPDTFHTTTQGFSVAAGSPLPSLNLSRVFVLTGTRTASASESVINGLRGINFEVILIGDTTTGKPYGFYATDNCGTTYFSTQFRGVNAQGFGDFADGFVPTETPIEEYEVQGCAVSDDYSRILGDIDEHRLATALGYIATSDCSAAPIIYNPAPRQALVLRQQPGVLQRRVQMPGTVRLK